MAADTIPLKEFDDRRRRLSRALKGAVGLVFAGGHAPDSPVEFRPHPHFEYLTGITDEPDAVLVLDPSCPEESRRVVLFLNSRDPEREQWEGYRDPICADLRRRLGIKTIYRRGILPRVLNGAARRARKLACLHPLAEYTQPVSPDLEIFRRISERVPQIVIEDHTETIAVMRAVKSAAEIAQIQKAVDVTVAGFREVIASIRSGMSEFDVQNSLEQQYRRQGSRQVGFRTIAGSGLNGTVLHYVENSGMLADGDLICIDSGACWNGYSADITRTVPINGRFTKRQREVYEVVLKAELAAIKAVKPGATLSAIDKRARAVIEKHGFGDAFMHSIGHHLGLQVHDITPDQPLKAGAVVTIEPGIYLPDEMIGIRIEDDVVVTAKGSRVLSSDLPKSVEDIEAMMKPR